MLSWFDFMWNTTTQELYEVHFSDKPAHLLVMQYTGLNDKNGVEIYEGDVVNYSNSYQNCVVEFRINLNNNRIELVPDDWMWILTACEVIGNKFQNPELLKELS